MYQELRRQKRDMAEKYLNNNIARNLNLAPNRFLQHGRLVRPMEGFHDLGPCPITG
jgi:hypothetical protein